MSALFMFAVIVLAVVAMVIAISKFKQHPFIVLVVVAVVVGLVCGIPTEDVIGTVKSGFGNILASIGIVILAGTIIGTILEKTGAALTMANSILKVVGKTSPWISVAGYSVATLTAIDRVRRNRHHWGDVLAGAAIGVLSTEAGYRLGDLLNKERKTVDMAVMPTGFQLIVNL